MKITGAQIVIKTLKKEGVNVLFGFPGGAVIPIFDELYRHRKNFRIFLPRHEQGGAHAADGYARVTGKVGVLIVTSGPGATNTITGIATAYMDSVPLVVITGQVPTYLIGSDAFQEVDVVGLTTPITKANFLVKNVDELAFTLKLAFHLAHTGRPGPVVVDIPLDIQKTKTEFAYLTETELKSFPVKEHPHPLQMKKAIDLIKQSRCPLVICGGGVNISQAMNELNEFINKFNSFQRTNCRLH